jgi:alpha,alpha-trehalase
MLDSRISAVRSFIHANWNGAVRQPDSRSPLEIHLPLPFTVANAGSFFQLFYYWGNFFTCEGLIRDQRTDLVLSNTENIFFLINEFGFVPNNTSREEIYCSNPPITSLLVSMIYKQSHDKYWLENATRILEKEYAFWMAHRLGPHNLNYYGWHGYPKEVEKYYFSIINRLKNIPSDQIERRIFITNALAEVESGWDFTPRFDRRCSNFYAIDLNSLLFIYEINFAEFYTELGSGDPHVWRQRALKRKTLMNKFCWNDHECFYYDYEYSLNQHSKHETSAAFFTLWAGIPSIEQAHQMVSKLSHLEYDYGLVACRSNQSEDQQPYHDQVYQWDFPNAWPPLQYAAIAGLIKYGFMEDAKRIAQKYVTCVTENFVKTENLWEKYNAVTGGIDEPEERGNLPLLGWTAGVFLYALDVLRL